MYTVLRRAVPAFAALAFPLLIGTCKGTTEARVATTVSIAPGPTYTFASLSATQRFTAAVKDQHGDTLRGAKVTWASNAAAVTIDTTGLATAVANGGARITATSGTATGSDSVTVAQVAAQVSKVSGDGQAGTVAHALSLAIVVQVLDATAHPIAGSAVSFAATVGGGSVGSPAATTDASGLAQTIWTLGQTAGSQSATATVTGAGAPATFSATANAGPATSVAKQAGDAQTTGTGTPVAIAPSVVVKDAYNNLVPGVLVTFAAASGGGAVGGATQLTSATGVATVGSWTLGSAGANTLTATVAGSGVTGNPLTFNATATAAGAAANVAAYVGNAQTGLVGYAVNVRPAVKVTDAGGAAVQGVSVTFAVASGSGSVTGPTVTTNVFGIAQVGSWALGAGAGTNTLTATATGSGLAGNPVTFSATGQTASYTIQVQNYGPAFSTAVQTAFDSAQAKWQRIIYQSLSTVSLAGVPAGYCGPGTPALSGTTSGLLILAKFDSIDGPGKILGQSGPCAVRVSNSLSVIGVMVFDTADVAAMITNGSLGMVILHEMGHVIGFGTLWNQSPNNCLQLSSTAPGTILDTYFSCANGRAAFDSLGGTSYTGAGLTPPAGNKVPVENCGTAPIVYPTCGAGSENSHWRELTFGNELMTGFISSGVNPLSLMSVASLQDLGYVVNYAAADAYVHVFTAPSVAGRAPIVMGDDIYHGPLYVVDDAGRIVKVLRR
jgi:hypothetical protein